MSQSYQEAEVDFEPRFVSLVITLSVSHIAIHLCVPPFFPPLCANNLMGQLCGLIPKCECAWPNALGIFGA